MSCSHFRWPALLALLLALACAGPPGARRVSRATLAPLIERVAAARQRPFTARVRARSVPQSSLSALLSAELDRVAPSAQIADEAAVAGALGLLPAGVDLRAAALAFQADNIAGYYSQTERRLYVVEGAAQPGEDNLLVHELAHALQDQRSKLLGLLLGIEGDDDLGFALSALLEGEATWIELEDDARQSGSARLSPPAFALRIEASAPAGGAEVPLLLRESIVRTYPLGYALADALAARGAAEALDAAHVSPPLSSEELLHPERYLDPALRVPLALLPREPALSGCSVTFTNSYGELGVQVWLRDAGLAREAAALAADGWDGDRAWGFACAGVRRSAWLIQHDDEAAARELELALLGRLEWRSELALRVDRAAARVLVSSGLDALERALLLRLPEEGRVASLAEYVAAHPEVRARARELRR